MNNVWNDLHKNYEAQDWIDKPSIFAQTAVEHFPKTGRVLELGAGLGQDGRYFASFGYDVVSTDLEQSAIEQAEAKITDDIRPHMTLQALDLRQPLPFEDGSFNIVYAHLSLHYFDEHTTRQIFREINRVLVNGGVVAFLVNSVHDPEYKTGKLIEEDFFQVRDATKRYFSVETARKFTTDFTPELLDDNGETYKDRAKGVHNLVRFIGAKADGKRDSMSLAFVGGIIERTHDGRRQLLLQTRYTPQHPSIYNGTFEFAAGKLDQPYENIYDALAREIKEETGLTLKQVIDDNQTKVFSPQNDGAFGFRPFCCTQQLKDGRPWIGFIFRCEVEDGEPADQEGESKNVHWVDYDEVKKMFDETPEKLFTLELPAWSYYFQEVKE